MIIVLYSTVISNCVLLTEDEQKIKDYIKENNDNFEGWTDDDKIIYAIEKLNIDLNRNNRDNRIIYTEIEKMEYSELNVISAKEYVSKIFDIDIEEKLKEIIDKNRISSSILINEIEKFFKSLGILKNSYNVKKIDEGLEVSWYYNEQIYSKTIR